MFKRWRSKQKQAVTTQPEDTPDIYELSDEEVEQLIGGTPINRLPGHPTSKSGQPVVPGQQFNHYSSSTFQEAFTLQPPSQRHWLENANGKAASDLPVPEG